MTPPEPERLVTNSITSASTVDAGTRPGDDIACEISLISSSSSRSRIFLASSPGHTTIIAAFSAPLYLAVSTLAAGSGAAGAPAVGWGLAAAFRVSHRVIQPAADEVDGLVGMLVDEFCDL